MKTYAMIALCTTLCLLSDPGAVAASSCCASAAAVAAQTPDNTLTPAEKALGYKLLFDGKTLSGWKCTDPNSKGWEVVDGTIFYNVKGGGYLATNERYGNFDLKIDFKVDHGTNSGIFFRWDDLRDPVQTGIEMQIYDSAGVKNPSRHDCGAIYDVLAPSENAMKPAMEWNSVLLRCRNNIISVTMNGKRIINLDLDKWTEPHKNPDGSGNKFRTAYKDMPREGHIGLQAHGGKLWFKNIKIRRL